MQSPNDMALFVKVAKTKSFRGAASTRHCAISLNSAHRSVWGCVNYFELFIDEGEGASSP
ncbi:MAG: hypothetical protein KIS65_04770 [Nitrosomonas sp.]|nr:hypothetical protein [Nitrosomonas sp.]